MTTIPHEVQLPFDSIKQLLVWVAFGRMMLCLVQHLEFYVHESAIQVATQLNQPIEICWWCKYKSFSILISDFRMDHTEAIEMHYDPTAISYQQLLELFWNNHEYALTTKIKKQYASLILYHNNEQKTMAEESLKQERLKHTEEMCTEIKPASIFYPAENYHQKYRLQQHPKLCNILMLNSRLLQDSHVAACLNGYVAGVGSEEMFNIELETFGLPDNLVEYVREVHKTMKRSGLYC